MLTSVESEQGVLGAILQNNDNLAEVMGKLVVKDFSEPVNQEIFQIITGYYEKNSSIDFITIADQLNEAGALGYLSDLMAQPGITKNVSAYIQRIKEVSLSRKLINLGNILVHSGETEEPKVLFETACQYLADLEELEEKQPRIIKEILVEYCEVLDQRLKEGGKLLGLSTGFTDLDERLNGLKPGNLIIIAGRPSMGKTTLGLNIAEHVGINEKQTALVFSLEMSEAELIEKHVASTGRIPLEQLQTGSVLTSEKYSSDFSKATDLLATANIVINDKGGINFHELRAYCFAVKRQYGLGLVVIDYLQLMVGQQGEQREAVVSGISRGLKALAKELQIPIIALSQLNRGVESRHIKKPVLSDLRESGSIEQDADAVILLYRDEYYEKKSQLAGIAEAIVAKVKMGKTGSVGLAWNGECSRFDNLSYQPDFDQVTARYSDKGFDL